MLAVDSRNSDSSIAAQDVCAFIILWFAEMLQRTGSSCDEAAAVCKFVS